MKKLFLSALISASIAQSAAAFSLTGTWTLDLSTGIPVVINQKEDNTFEGYCNYSEAMLAVLGSNATFGEKCLYGTVNPTTQTFTGKVLVYDAISYKEKCPTQSAQWTNWVDIVAGYKPITNALVGIRKTFAIKDDCSQVEDANIRTITYAAPNHCVAVYGILGETGLLSIPCLDVTIPSPTGDQRSKYSVGLEQQNIKDFTFNLNLNTIQKQENFQMNR